MSVYDIPLNGVAAMTAKVKGFISRMKSRVRSCHDSDKLQTDLGQLHKWESILLMEFHPSKCQAISITKK